MSVTTSETSTNIQLQVLQFGGYSFPQQSTIKIDHVNGMKEGTGTVVSSDKIVLALLNFHNDKLNGLSIFFNSDGRKEKEMFYKDDSLYNWGREFKNDRVVFEGLYLNGERYSELRKHSGNSSFLEEVREGRIVSISKYNDNHEKVGKGQLFEYDGLLLKEVFDLEDGEKSAKRIEFDNKRMKVLNDNGCVVYEGGFQGNPREGFKRNGEGEEFDDNGLLVYSGNWKDGERNGNGLVYDNGILMFEGEWSEGRPYGHGKLYNNDGEVILERMWRNKFDDLRNGIFRISDNCYVEIDKNEVYVNELKQGGFCQCGDQWRRRSFNKLNVNDRNELMKRNNYMGVMFKPVETNRRNDRPMEILNSERDPLEGVMKRSPMDTNKPVETNRRNDRPMEVLRIERNPLEGYGNHGTNNYKQLTVSQGTLLIKLMKDEVMKSQIQVLVISEGCGNELKEDLKLCGFESLKSFTVKKNSLKNLNSLKISNNPVLKSIKIEDSDYGKGSFTYLNSVVIESVIIVK